MVGNFDVDVAHQQRVGHLFGPFPKQMRDDTAFMDRIHAYMPGLGRAQDEHGPVHRALRPGERLPRRDAGTSCASSRAWRAIQGRVQLGGALSGRDTTAVNKTVDGLLKLLYPDPSMAIADEDIEWAVRLALESRRRVKEQQKRIGAMEFRNTHFSYTLGEDGVEQFVATPEIQSEDSIGIDPLPPGQVWAISPGGRGREPGPLPDRGQRRPGLRREGPQQARPAPFRESIRFAEQNLLARAKELVGDRDPRQHEFMVQLRAFDAAKSGAGLGVPVLLALASGAAREEPPGRPHRDRRHQPRRRHRDRSPTP